MQLNQFLSFKLIQLSSDGMFLRECLPKKVNCSKFTQHIKLMKVWLARIKEISGLENWRPTDHFQYKKYQDLRTLKQTDHLQYKKAMDDFTHGRLLNEWYNFFIKEVFILKISLVYFLNYTLVMQYNNENTKEFIFI